MSGVLPWEVQTGFQEEKPPLRWWEVQDGQPQPPAANSGCNAVYIGQLGAHIFHREVCSGRVDHERQDPLLQHLDSLWHGERQGCSKLRSCECAGQVCTQFLHVIPLKPQLKGAAALLLKPLTQELVLTALDKMKPGSAPGLDGISAEILTAFPDTLVPRMTEHIALFLSKGSRREEWALGILNPIPKQQGSISVEHLRPLCLQSVMFKWVSMTLYLMMQDLLLFATPPPRTKRVYQGQASLNTSGGDPPGGRGYVATRPTCGPLLILPPALMRWGPPKAAGVM